MASLFRPKTTKTYTVTAQYFSPAMDEWITIAACDSRRAATQAIKDFAAMFPFSHTYRYVTRTTVEETGAGSP